MLGRRRSATTAAADAAATVGSYADPLIKDEVLRRRLTAALAAGVAARTRARRQVGLTGVVRRLATDAVLRAQLAEMVVQLRKAEQRATRARSHKLRNVVVVLGAVGTAAAVAKVAMHGGGSDDGWHEADRPAADASEQRAT